MLSLGLQLLYHEEESGLVNLFLIYYRMSYLLSWGLSKKQILGARLAKG